MNKQKKIVIIGGGAAGFFLAANLPKSTNYEVILLEKASKPLQKVKISGGGRCNVTNATFDPKELVENYPRGKKELLSVFSKFQPADTFSWFEERGLELKIENDNRVFPITDNSESIITILAEEVQKNKIQVHFNESVKSINIVDNQYIIKTKENQFIADKLIITTGSSAQMWNVLEPLNHTVIKSVPSLFTFNIKDNLLEDMMGTSFPMAEVSIPELKQTESGPLLITHWGLSGPAILKLSAFAARELADLAYHFTLQVNFLNQAYENCLETLLSAKKDLPKKQLMNAKPYEFITKKFWNKCIKIVDIQEDMNLADIPNQKLQDLAKLLTQSTFSVNGKSTFKEEFVTAGGIDLKEINFKNMESKLHKNLFFAGEVLNIDAITGGFNFQACWSEAFLIAEYLKNN